MPELKYNHRQVLAAKAINGKRTQYRITGIRGLVLDVRPTGAKTWFVRYQPGGRKSRSFRWYKIGDADVIGLKDAADRADEVVRAVQKEHRDPFVEEIKAQREGKTFGELFEEWHRRYAMPKLKRAATDRIYYRRHLEPEFAKTKLSDLNRVDIGRFRDAVAKDASPLTSNSIIVLINRVLNWAVDEGLMEVNPAARLRKAGSSKPRERVLSQTDMTAFWNTLAGMDTMTGDHMGRAEKGRMLSPSTRSILRILMLTGQRRTEVTEAEKAELLLDGPEPVWTIPGKRTKNGLLHRLPLCPMAAAEFRKAMSRAPARSPYVFPSEEDPLRSTITPDSITRAMARLIKELGIPKVSPHDLRRTVGTEMARLGLPAHVRSLVLNHSPQTRGVTDAVYNRYAYDKEKREALTTWEQELARLIAAPGSLSRRVSD